MKKQISVLITDMDNTLYDWVRMWHSSFKAMLDQIIAISGLPQPLVEKEIQAVFQKHGTSEYSFVIEEMPSIKAKHPDGDLKIIYEEAIKAYRLARKENLFLYPGVIETLTAIKQAGCKIVVFTESLEFYSMIRVKKLGLDGVVDFIYSPPDHETPAGNFRIHEDDYYRLSQTVHRFIPKGELKPNPKILLNIMADGDIQAARETTAYVGDSLMKDISMAQDAGVTDIYARYGVAQDTAAYELLRRVTHWTKEDVEREKAILAGRVVEPSYVLEKSFAELLEMFEFVRPA